MTTTRLDLSLAQRLAIGFGALLLILGVLIAFIYDRQARSSSAQRTFVEEIAPRTELTRALQDEVLSLAIAVRSYLLAPDAGRLERYGTAKDDVRTALERLVSAQDVPASSRVDFAPSVEHYIQVVERIVTRAADSGLTPAQELEMAQAREAAVSQLRELAQREREETSAALASMTAARSNVQTVLVGTSMLMVLCFVGLASATTRSIAVPARELVQVASALEGGDWRPALTLAASPRERTRRRRDEMRILSAAFGSAAVALERRAERLNADREVASAAASTLEKPVLADRVLRAILHHLRAEVGVVYARAAGGDVFEAVAQYALAGELPPVKLGEGIPGQAAKDGRTLAIRNIPPDSTFAVRLGYDRAPARTVVAVPLRFGDTVHGVAVVGSLHDVDDEGLAFVEAAGSQLGVGLQNAVAHEEIERLLTDLRETNQRLQAQSEELQAQNEEIQAQNEEIQSQNEELQAQTEELHAQHDEIQRRTQQLEQQSAELRRQAARLTDADERKNEFLGLLAHELRNPLAPMTVSVYILKQAPPGSERALRAQAVIERQVHHLARLTDDLLDVTRISHGKIQVAREPLNLVEIVRSCIEDQQGPVAAKSLALDVDLPSTAVWVDGDRTRLCQVLNNLLSNAAKFTDPNGRIGVRLQQDGREAILDLSDSGTGIEPSFLPRIFEPFTQGTTNLARAHGGLGLGLALVKALIQLHDGSVEAYSDGPGSGSRFRVRLPLCAKAVSPPEPMPIAAPAAPLRILLVEDNVDAAVSLKEALELQGHHVEVAHTGSEGLERARTLLPDLVLCDIGLPTMDGYEVARRLRSDDRLRSTTIVAVSGYAAEHDKARAVAAGFDRHLSKPLTLELLSRVLADLPNARMRSDI